MGWGLGGRFKRKGTYGHLWMIHNIMGFPGGSFQSQINAMPKHVQTTAQFELISHANKVMLKILQARLQQYVNKLNLEKAGEPDIKLPTSVGS